MNPPKLFISHSSKDKIFARKLHVDLKNMGADVWIDEGEIKIGESLKTKIYDSLKEIDFLLLLISTNSINSSWVQKELNYIIKREKKENKIVILPILYEKCQLPKIISDRLYADFSNPRFYSESLESLIERVGLSSLIITDEEQLNKLKKIHPLLQENVSQDILLSSQIPVSELIKYLFLTIKLGIGDLSYIISIVIEIINLYDTGYHIFDYLVEKSLLTEQNNNRIAMLFSGFSSKKGIVWAHHFYTNHLKNDTYYNSFIQKHFAIIKEECFDEMMKYLLFPDRGPSHYNIDTFSLIIQNTSNNSPFICRWREWIRAGFFDFDTNLRERDEHVPTELLYTILSRHSEANLLDEIHDHVYQKLKFGKVIVGLNHLIAMIYADYEYLPQLMSKILNRIDLINFSVSEKTLYFHIERTVDSKINKPNSEFEKMKNEIIYLDVELGCISGFYNKTT